MLPACLHRGVRIFPRFRGQKDKAAALEAFSSEAKGEVGAATKARRKEKEAAEKARQETERQEKEKEEMERKQVISFAAASR